MDAIGKQLAMAVAATAFRDVGPTCRMSEIASRLELPRRAVYKYFEDLLAAKYAAVTWYIEAMDRLVTDPADEASSARARLRIFFQLILDLELCDILADTDLKDWYHDVRTSTFHALMEKGRNQGSIKHSYTDDSVAYEFCTYVWEGYASKIKSENIIDGECKELGSNEYIRFTRSNSTIDHYLDLLEPALGISSMKDRKFSTSI